MDTERKYYHQGHVNVYYVQFEPGQASVHEDYKIVQWFNEKGSSLFYQLTGQEVRNDSYCRSDHKILITTVQNEGLVPGAHFVCRVKEEGLSMFQHLRLGITDNTKGDIGGILLRRLRSIYGGYTGNSTAKNDQ
ncbi:hypothetical protein BELL_1339g00030 [Botrytis elliptica]|uniref:Uncharacterized protein n=1 Tax=Botrytis elliptica TaxID=278938 RepID=A0A4Z1I7C3_9HELO|nr:hypothetical protein BELL_1339g00030 [Botrytis elliptica]